MTKRIVILGGGESGVGAAILAKQKGFDVFVSDFGKIKPKYKETLESNDLKWEENQHTEQDILNADEIIKSPGIADDTKIMKSVINKEIPVISEIEFAGRYSDAIKICITGSNGKTTTASLIYHLMKKANMNVGLAGNIGESFAYQVAEKQYDYYVLEISSFQLDNMYNFKADISILLNITPDHLDRYDYQFQNYVDSKFRITQNQTKDDSLIYCSDDEVIMSELEKHNIQTKKYPFSIQHEVKEGGYVKDNSINLIQNHNLFTMTLQELALQGRHNTYNSMAAGISGQLLKIRKQTIRESLRDFQSVEHRLEPVVKVHGIEFINDSKATNVNSTWYALETIGKPIIWIVGGVDKGNDYSMLKELVGNKVKAIICLGVDNKKLHKAFGNLVETIMDAGSMSEAVKASYYLSKKDDTVLLSPACASFDLFESYEDRGQQFKQAVRNL